MKKRRRAYKKYDWRRHTFELLTAQLFEMNMEHLSKAIDLAVLYGEKAVHFDVEEVTLEAGKMKITVPVRIPYALVPASYEFRSKLTGAAVPMMIKKTT